MEPGPVNSPEDDFAVGASGSADPDGTQPSADPLASADSGDDAEIISEVGPPWRLAALAAFIGLVICTQVANAVWARWLDSRPEQLLMLSSRMRYLLLATNKDIEFPLFFLIGGLRLLVAAIVCFALGWAYNTKVIWFFTRFLGMTRTQVSQMQAAFGKAQWLLIPWFAGSNIICAIAGITRVKPKRFIALVSAGIAARMVLVWIIGDVFSDQIDKINGKVSRYQMPLLIVSIALVVLVNGRNLIRGERD